MSKRRSQQKGTAATCSTDASEVKPSDRHLPKYPRMQNYVVIWMQTNLKELDMDYHFSLERLRQVVHEVIICTESEQCIQYVNEIDDKKIFIILPGTLGQDLVPQIHNKQTVDTIYIHCRSKTRHKYWIQEWAKIEGVFTSVKYICDSLQKATRQCDHDSIPMSFIVNQLPVKMSKVTANECHLDEINWSYICTMLFKDIILEIDDDDNKALKNLVSYCHDKGMLMSILSEFERQYYKKTAIWWYTCEIFLHGMLNEALRSLNIEVMVRLSFFIRSLHRQLVILHKEQSSIFKQAFIVYRGQGVSPEDFQHLQTLSDGLLSFNGFLSTNMEKQMAMKSIKNNLNKYKENFGIVFTMIIDQTKQITSKTAFAFIEKYSASPIEQEILFSMCTLFRVVDIEQMTGNDRLWEILLTIADDNDPYVANLNRYMKNELDGTGWFRMCHFMFRMERFELAEKLYHYLAKNDSDDSHRSYIYHQLGVIKIQQGLYQQAIACLQKALETQQNTMHKDDLDASAIYNNLALVYENIGDTLKAVEYYEMSQKIKEKLLVQTHPKMAISYNNIAGIFKDMGDHFNALQYYKKALKINEQFLPEMHPDFTIYYNNIAMVYNAMGEHSKALEYYERSCDICEKSLPSTSINLATSYNNIGLVYKNMGNYSKAIEFCEKALEIKNNHLSSTHPDLATSYNNIGAIYFEQGDRSKSLFFFEKALDLLAKSVPSTHPVIQVTKYNIKYVNENM